MRKTVAIIASLLMALAATAQESAFTADAQRLARLPMGARNVTVVDSNLYCYAGGVLMRAQRIGGDVLGFLPDTVFTRLNGNVDYVVRHPSGDLYFTAKDSKGRSTLFRHTAVPGKKSKPEKLKMNDMAVEHPTFTVDGRIMVFCTADERGNGGYDLWYSQLEEGIWGRPINIGTRLNSKGDEVSPTIYRDCLIFASNGHNNRGDYDVFATRLISDQVTGDTIGMLQIGRSRLQCLPDPLNSPSDDLEMAIDTAPSGVYWVSNREAGVQFYHFAGPLDGLMLWGRVKDKMDHQLPNVRIAALQNGRQVCHTTTDKNGFYRLYLQSDSQYELTFQLDDYFTLHEQINTEKNSSESLIAESMHEVRLDRLPLGQRIYYKDLFGPNVDIELSDYGREQLKPLIRFLCDNPRMAVTMSLTSDATTDNSFNSLLTQQRLQALSDLFFRSVPSSVTLDFVNGCQTGCDTAKGGSRLAVTISKLP